jgi:uncharacterized membrane protein
MLPDRDYKKQVAREALRESMRREGITPKEDVVTADDEITLTPRERAVARAAAEMAVEELADKFYKQVGKTVITKILVWIGALALGFAAGKGWVTKL